MELLTAINLKMRARCRISIVLLYTALYYVFRDTVSKTKKLLDYSVLIDGNSVCVSALKLEAYKDALIIARYQTAHTSVGQNPQDFITVFFTTNAMKRSHWNYGKFTKWHKKKTTCTLHSLQKVNWSMIYYENPRVTTLAHWTVADPGFPRGGAPTLEGAPTYHFAKFSHKLHEIERSTNVE